MLDVDDENACSIDLINFSFNKRVQLREMSTADHTPCALQRVVYSGWPDTIKDLPKDLRPYWSFRDEIGISDGVIFKGKQVIIPDAMRSDILHQQHAAHLGIEKIRLLMRESVYWPNIYKDIETMVKCCAVCQESQTEHRRHSTLSSPSQILFNRPIHTTLPSHHPTLMQQNQQQTNKQLQQRRDLMRCAHDQRAGPEIPALLAG